MNIWETNPLDPIPVKDYSNTRRTQVRAVAALLRMDALDLLPILFAPPSEVTRTGGGTCPVCGRHRPQLRSGRCRRRECIAAKVNA